MVGGHQQVVETALRGHHWALAVEYLEGLLPLLRRVLHAEVLHHGLDGVERVVLLQVQVASHLVRDDGRHIVVRVRRADLRHDGLVVQRRGGVWGGGGVQAGAEEGAGEGGGPGRDELSEPPHGAVQGAELR